MPAHFCPECGTPTLPNGNFCAQCGFALSGAIPRRPDAVSFRPTMLGGLVLGGFLAIGLGIWAAILTPDAPAPRPGQVASAPPASGQGTPTTRELPEEITKMVADLAARAEAKPDDLDLWTHLGEVYYRTSQFDPSYRSKALEAFDYVLERDPDRVEAIRGKGNVLYDAEDAPKAIAQFERYLELKPDDSRVRTDLATMYLANDEHDRGLALYRAVIADDPHFMQAHYNLAAALHQDGDSEGALAELRLARGLTEDEALQGRIDALIARLEGGEPPGATPATESAAPTPEGDRTPFQTVVESSFRSQEIMGPRIASIDWTGPGEARVLMRGFPMDAMPPMVRDKFETRLRETLDTAAEHHPVKGPRSVTLVDAESGRVMATVRP